MVILLKKETQEGSLKLFTNDEEHLTDNNQDSFRLNYLQDLLKQQAVINEQLSDQSRTMENKLSSSYQAMNHQVQILKSSHQKQYENVLHQMQVQDTLISKFILFTEKQESNNAIILERLSSLEESNTTIVQLLQQEEALHEEMLNQLHYQDASTQSLARKLDVLETFSEQLTEKMATQELVNEELDKKMDVQEMFHNTVMERLDQQEALTDKMMRQLDSLKSAIYERASYLSEKFETQFKLIAKPVQSFFLKQTDTKDEEQKKI